MLSKSDEKLTSVKKTDPNAGRFVVRLKFRKVGNLQYISHLDLQRTFNRVIKRSGIPVWYTQGFNPHMKLVFSSPLSIGTESVCEYLDLSMQGDITCAEIMERLNKELTDELSIVDAYIAKRNFSEIAWADYSCEIFTEGGSADIAERAEEMFKTSPYYMVKSTKSGDKEIDIVHLIKNIKVGYDEGFIKIKARLSATSTNFLNPQMLITAMKDRFDILSKNPAVEWYTVMREDLLDQEEKSFG